MKISIKKTIGNSVILFEVDQAKSMDALMEAGFLAQTPDQCGKCGNKNVQLSSNKAEGYTFIKVVCQNCRAQSNMGQYKDGGYFWKKFEIWQGKEEGADQE